MHLEEENPERIDQCIRLYTDDAEWEAPTRLVNYRGRETIKKMYLKVFAAVEDFVFTPVERWITLRRSCPIRAPKSWGLRRRSRWGA
jgi:hypothetical protein